MDIDSIRQNTNNNIAFSEKAYSDVFKNLIPLVDVEVPIDTTASVYDPAMYGDYIQALICKLIETQEYRMTFKYNFPLHRYMSLMAVYVSTTFVPSIGQLKDGWAATVLEKRGGGQWIGFGKFGGMRTWRGNEGTKKSFRKAKRNLRQMLEASCNTNYLYKDRDLPTPSEAYVDTQRPKDDKGFGIKWWQWSSLRPPPCKEDE